MAVYPAALRASVIHQHAMDVPSPLLENFSLAGVSLGRVEILRVTGVSLHQSEAWHCPILLPYSLSYGSLPCCMSQAYFSLSTNGVASSCSTFWYCMEFMVLLMEAHQDAVQDHDITSTSFGLNIRYNWGTQCSVYLQMLRAQGHHNVPVWKENCSRPIRHHPDWLLPLTASHCW